MGIRCKDGVVLAVERLILNKMLEDDVSRSIFSADRHVGVASAGLMADARQLLYRARDESQNYRNVYGTPVPGHVLADRMSSFMHMHTLYGNARPFGVSILLATYDSEGPKLHMVEPSGESWGYWATAVGQGAQAAKTELEKLKFAKLTAKQAVKEAARMYVVAFGWVGEGCGMSRAADSQRIRSIYAVHDDSKDKPFKLELAWVCDDSNRQFAHVPEALFNEAVVAAKKAKEEAD